MTQKQRIEELERKIIELEARLAAQEARPTYIPYPYPSPQPRPYYPQFPYSPWRYNNSASSDTTMFTVGGGI